MLKENATSPEELIAPVADQAVNVFVTFAVIVAAVAAVGFVLAAYSAHKAAARRPRGVR